MIKRFYGLLRWLISLFDPPPLKCDDRSRRKTGRVADSHRRRLVIGSILVAMLGAVGLFLMEKGRELGSTPRIP